MNLHHSFTVLKNGLMPRHGYKHPNTLTFGSEVYYFSFSCVLIWSFDVLQNKTVLLAEKYSKTKQKTKQFPK